MQKQSAATPVQMLLEYLLCVSSNMILGLISTHSDENSLSLKDSSQDDVENNNITEEDDEDFIYADYIS